MSRLDQSVALGVGVAGVLVDVSEYADLDAGVEYQWGRDSEFDDVDAGEWSFVLDNADGRFTPDNVSSPLDTPLTEGAAVCWQLGDRLVAGRVIAVEPLFPGDESAWAQVQVTCDDMLGEAGRTEITSSTESLIRAAGAQAYWPLETDFTEDGSFRELGWTANELGLVSFEGELVPNGTTELSTTSLLGETRVISSLNSSLVTDWISFWFTPITASGTITLRFGILARQLTFQDCVLSVTGSAATLKVEPLTPMHYNINGSTGEVYVNGVLTHSGSTGFDGQFINLRVDGSVAECGMQISQLAFTDERVDAWSAGPATLGDRCELFAGMIESFNIDVSTDVWDAPVGVADVSGQSVLDGLNHVIRTEQGHMYTRTTGTLLSPTQTVVIRERDRPLSVTATFDVEDDLEGAPDLIRDLTNLVSAIRVRGTDDDVTVTDAALVARAGSSNTSEDTILANRSDLALWGQDRLRRGANIRLRVSAATVDAMTTATDRETDLLSLVAGDRVRFTGLPSTVLGFDEWDGWLIGGEEEHTTVEHVFTFSFAPVLPPVPVFNAARFAAGHSLSLSAGINAAVTSMSVATTDATFTTDTTDLPLSIIVDDEIMSVTAVTSATPQVFTVVRGQSGSTAASHLAGAQVELWADDPTADATFITNYITNPSLEVDATGYSTIVGTSGWAATTTRNNGGAAYAGTWRSLTTCTTASTSAGAGVGYVQQGMADLFITGESWTWSGYMRTNLAAQRMVCQLDWLDSGGATLSSTTGSAVIISSSLSPLFQRASVTSTIPSGADGVRLRFISAAGASFVNWSIADVLVLDAVMGSKGTVLYDYHDGSFPNGVLICSWAEEPHMSWSYAADNGQVVPAIFAF